MTRIDVFLFSSGYAKSREAARKSIEAGLVFVDGKQVVKPSEKIDDSAFHNSGSAPANPAADTRRKPPR